MNEKLYCVVSYYSNDDPGHNLTGPVPWKEAHKFWLEATNEGRRFVLKTEGCWMLIRHADESPPVNPTKPRRNRTKK